MSAFSLCSQRPFILVKVIDGFMDHEPIKISFFVIDILLFSLLKWIVGHNIPAWLSIVTNNMNEFLASLNQHPGPIPPIKPPTSLTKDNYGDVDEFSIYHRDEFNDKS